MKLSNRFLAVMIMGALIQPCLANEKINVAKDREALVNYLANLENLRENIVLTLREVDEEIIKVKGKLEKVSPPENSDDNIPEPYQKFLKEKP